ncbi:MAG TPA: hypothetical protein VFN61_06290 [Acidimicrobiales bacterium]|nr:hypothetical protein [Acidimicrobiales bacterium]
MSPKRHVTRHGTSSRGDALELLRSESVLLASAFRQWDEATGAAQRGRMAGAANFDKGTVGKVILEHAAVHLGAARDVCRVLHNAPRVDELERIEQVLADVWPVIDRLDELGRGTEPVAVAANEDFADAVSKLRTVLEPLTDDPALADRLAGALADRRHELRTAQYIRRHSPTHPGPGRWYNSIGPLARLQTAYDRSRGFPWAESQPMASPDIAQAFDSDLTSSGM